MLTNIFTAVENIIIFITNYFNVLYSLFCVELYYNLRFHCTKCKKECITWRQYLSIRPDLISLPWVVFRPDFYSTNHGLNSQPESRLPKFGDFVDFLILSRAYTPWIYPLISFLMYHSQSSSISIIYRYFHLNP
jgi:hypothetical protein